MQTRAKTAGQLCDDDTESDIEQESFTEITETHVNDDPEAERTQQISVTDEHEEPFNCGMCNQDLVEKPYHIGCDGACLKWYHICCVNLSKAEYDVLEADKSSKWHCKSCEKSTLSQTIADIRSEVQLANDQLASDNISNPPPSQSTNEYIQSSARKLWNPSVSPKV